MNRDSPFRSKLLDLPSRYFSRGLGADLGAGIMVALFALPLCLAFGTASGLGPWAGLITSVAAGIAAVLGGSRVQITGPTAAFIVVVGGVVTAHGIGGLAIATVLAGVLLVLFALFRLGPVFRLLPQPILVGFTAGIAVTLVISQVKVLWGTDWLPANGWALVVGAIAALGVGVGDRWLPRVPWGLLAVIIGVLAVSLGLPVPTLGTAFASEPLLRPFDWSALNYQTILQLFPSAFTLAFLGAVESLLSASVADGLVGDRHRSNAELVGQGAANIFSALLGGLPATGATGRTNVNVRSGGRTPLAAITHSVVLLALWGVLGWAVTAVPVAVLAGIVVSVAFTMVDFREFRLILKTTQADALALITTFLVTIAVDLAFAVIAGLLVAFFFFVRGMAQSSRTISTDRTTAANLPPGVHVLDLDGAFFFGAAAKFDEAIRPLLVRAQTVILRMDDVSLLDATGTRVLHRILADAVRDKVRVVMCEVQPPVLRVMDQAELIHELGTANLFASFEGALKNIRSQQPLVFGKKLEEGTFDPQ
jgi:SulP family sulfate permease